MATFRLILYENALKTRKKGINFGKSPKTLDFKTKYM